ncbi:sigma-54-dependent Fis family transcriptional regulator [Bacillus sp. FJAT-49705]|uniref:Sigma-54-dependent Fis family transcriptional regulator n=1 Tax=Cytobacillus citreus TaxID=2833586 RepID=A0ABS5NQT5_9BACI|nr:sigma 54-interacting transcriptional regulator [Cytobacillus citreus]MBS4190172.1 sigma-54-dependent Fis family transcriptional regulator [Cytobacillus citreus]
MAEKIVTIISIQDEYLSLISKQMTEMAGDLVRIRPINIKNLAREKISKDEIVLLGSILIQMLVHPFLPDGVRCILGKRGFNYVNMGRLLSVPKGKRILVVNDTEQTTEETIQALREVVFEHKYYAYHPDAPIPEQIDFVITPGEMQLVPEGIAEVIDIGYRLLSLDTVFEIFEILELNYSQTFLTNRYMKSLVALSNQNKNFKIDSTFNKGAEHTASKTAKYYFEDVIAHSQAMKDALYIFKKFTGLNDPVHIYGETGTGKRMLAQAIHNDSPVKMGPYLNINCAARLLDVLERDLFGSEIDGKISPGLFELASGGTLCIEEIDEIPFSLQGRLLQVLEEGQIIRVGGHSPIPIKVRIITTSNSDLSLLVDDNKFRRDLFYYLAALTCKVPSLSERKEDFEPLIQIYLKSYLQRNDLNIPQDMIHLLMQYSWPGNVKELFNAVSYMACLKGKKLSFELLPFYIKGRLQKNMAESVLPQEMSETELNALVVSIEEHGFLEESRAILEVFEQGKKQCESYGRTVVRKKLQNKGIDLTEQQLRLRLEVLNQLELLNVRQGRSGTTISRKGELFLEMLRIHGAGSLVSRL